MFAQPFDEDVRGLQVLFIVREPIQLGEHVHNGSRAPDVNRRRLERTPPTGQVVPAILLSPTGDAALLVLHADQPVRGLDDRLEELRIFGDVIGQQEVYHRSCGGAVVQYAVALAQALAGCQILLLRPGSVRVLRFGKELRAAHGRPLILLLAGNTRHPDQHHKRRPGAFVPGHLDKVSVPRGLDAPIRAHVVVRLEHAVGELTFNEHVAAPPGHFQIFLVAEHLVRGQIEIHDLLADHASLHVVNVTKGLQAMAFTRGERPERRVMIEAPTSVGLKSGKEIEELPAGGLDLLTKGRIFFRRGRESRARHHDQQNGHPGPAPQPH